MNPRRARFRPAHLIAFALVALSPALAAPLTPARASAAEVLRRSIPGDRVALHNLVGALTVVEGEGSAVTAEITLLGDDSGRLRIEQGTLRGIPSLRVVYPSDRIHVEGFHGRSMFWVRGDGTLDGKSGDGHRVEVSGKGGLDASADVTLRVPRGRRVDVYWGHGSGRVRGVDGEVSIDGASLEVAASDVKGSLRVSVGSGEVSVTRGRGSIKVETGSGDVTLREIDGDALSIETGSGAIRATDLDLPAIALGTGSGDIHAESVRAERASLETGSGSVGLLLDGDVATLTVESGSGDLDVSVPRGFGASVHMETGSGSLESEVPIQISSKSRHELHGTIGHGRGRVSLETGSGSIVIRGAR
jgi:lia operon protein LiaG